MGIFEILTYQCRVEPGVRQANAWEELNPTGLLPVARSALSAVWSKSADGIYIFGGQTIPSGSGPSQSSEAC